jgi:hypothetical protein
LHPHSSGLSLARVCRCVFDQRPHFLADIQGLPTILRKKT